MSKVIAEEYASSLADLTVNSKPLINMLTILAEENIDHAGVIVETVEKHLEKVNPEIKLPVLYLVDSIIKNVGGAYTTKFSQSIVNMFTRTFKQVDEKIRSQMFKLRETWHDVFPATKLYQLDVKVNLIDPAWPIQAQPQQSNIHVNPNFLKKTPSTSATPRVSEDDEKMRSIIVQKEQELLMLQKKKVEKELEQMRRQLELDKTAKKQLTTAIPAASSSPVIPLAMVNPVVAPAMTPLLAPVLPSATPVLEPEVAPVPVRQRLGPPVNKPAGAGRIAPVSAALATARRDPRLARHTPPAPKIIHPPPPPPPPAPTVPPIASNVFDIKPLERVTKRKNVITIDVRPDATREVRRRDPRLDKRDARRDKRRDERPRRLDPNPPPTTTDRDDRKKEPKEKEKTNKLDDKADERNVNIYMDKLQIADPKRINRLPPIPKINREDQGDLPTPKRKKELTRDRKKKKEDVNANGKEKDNSSSGSSPEKKGRTKDIKKKLKDTHIEESEKASPEEVVAFKELKNFNKERYMRRNKEKSESPERIQAETEAPPVPDNESSNIPVVTESKDVDLRVLPAVEPKPGVIAQKRSSTEALEGKPKKNKIDKFDILFGNEDVDLRQLPQVEEVAAPPPPSITESPKSPILQKKEKSTKKERKPSVEEEADVESLPLSPKGSPKKDWNEVKEKKEKEEVKKTPSKLDLVRAKLAEATKGKDRLGRPLLFSKSPSIEKERRRTLSSQEDTDMRAENGEEFDAEDHKKTISIIMSQAKEQFSDGQLDKNQYNALMYQVLQLNEKLKLKEAKQRESLEISKRKLKAHIQEENKIVSPKSSPSERNRFGDIDERTLPSMFVDTLPDNQGFMQDSDMRNESMEPSVGMLPLPPAMPMFGPMPSMPKMPFPPMWRGQPRLRTGQDDFPRRFRGPTPPFFRGNLKFDKRSRVPFDVPRMPLPLPTPQIGMCQGENPLQPYERCESPPPLGAPGFIIPPTDFKIIDYIDQDPVKTIQIDGIPREIRFYGDTAVIMLDWDDPREIKFLPGCRRVTFDNKDSVVISFNEGYKQVEIEDQVFDIKFGAPTRELYINGRWHECCFGGSPLGVIIDGKPRLVHLEGPLPQVDIGKVKRTDLVAGKINLIVDATKMCPVYLDAKVQKFVVDNQVFTIRFVDALRTVLINEQPFKVEYGDLPKPIFIGNEKHFVRFSALPRHIKPGFVQIAQMEGCGIPTVPMLPISKMESSKDEKMEVDEPTEVVEPLRPVKTPSPEVMPENQGLDMLASVMPTPMEFAPGSDYSLAEPLYTGKPDKIPGLETPMDEKPITLPVLGSINVTDLFAKLVATGIVQNIQVPLQNQNDSKLNKGEEARNKQREDKSTIHKVDLLRPETLRRKQPGIVAKLYGGMQCSGCGSRFPPEQTVRYSQHLDWHFRQNRRERDGARRAHNRHWHYDLADWLQYEEIDELDDREKNWFETGGAEEGEAPTEPPAEAPSVAAGAPADCHCAMCGDKFDQFYNEDKEEWHLRNSVRHEDQNYHPMCFEDYKASLAKEAPAQESVDEVVAVDKTEEAIEIADAEDESTLDDDDDNDVVEVLEDTEKPADPEPLEIDEGDEDDVIYKAEPVEEVVVDDEADTDDETTEKRAERDRQAEIDYSKVKVKQEPVDPDDEPVITAEEESVPVPVVPETSHVTVLSSIDGNVQLEAAPAPRAAAPVGGIRINISKSTIPTFISTPPLHQTLEQSLEDVSADDEPLPPGEEPELEYKLKPALEGVSFSRQPPLHKGSELSGLCSIM